MQLDYYAKKRLSFIKQYIKHNLEHIKIRSRYKVKQIVRNTDKLQYPKTLQFPITNRCNLNCVMCNIHANEKKEIPMPELKRILSDKIFSQITSVGINGGEPFMLKNICEYISTILETLPTVKRLFIISNGTYTERTLTNLPVIKELCDKHGVILTQSFSIDGYGEIHDRMRGVKGTFKKLMATVDAIRSEQSKYCHNINFICTVTTKNVYELELLEAFSKKIGIKISYNIATDHERLKNACKRPDYSLLDDEHAKMVAAEFLHKKFVQTGHTKYFSLFKYLTHPDNLRLDNCYNLHEAITLCANGDICFCATHSKVLGNALRDTTDIHGLYFGNQAYNDEIRKTYCDGCSHYMGGISADNHHLLVEEKLKLYKLFTRL